MRKKIYSFTASLGLMFFFVAPAYGQSAQLIEAAKQEGKVAMYGSLESDTGDAVFRLFKKKTGIEVDYWRASANKVLDRALNEYRDGKPLCDVILPHHNPLRT